MRDHYSFSFRSPPLPSTVSVSGQLNVAYAGNLAAIAPAANRVLAFPVGLTGRTFSDKLLVLNHGLKDELQKRILDANRPADRVTCATPGAHPGATRLQAECTPRQVSNRAVWPYICSVRKLSNSAIIANRIEHDVGTVTKLGANPVPAAAKHQKITPLVIEPGQPSHTLLYTVIVDHAL